MSKTVDSISTKTLIDSIFEDLGVDLPPDKPKYNPPMREREIDDGLTGEYFLGTPYRRDARKIPNHYHE